jgi:hypothetical protein
VLHTSKGDVDAARADSKKLWVPPYRHGCNAWIGGWIGFGASLFPVWALGAYANNENAGGAARVASTVAAGTRAVIGAWNRGRRFLYRR